MICISYLKLSRKLPQRHSIFKISVFFAFTLDTFVKFTKHFLEKLLKNSNSEHEFLL